MDRSAARRRRLRKSDAIAALDRKSRPAMLSGSLVRAVPAAVLVMSLGILVAPCATSAQDKGNFDQESNPVRKAKAFEKVGQGLISQFGQQAADGNFEAALHTLTNYRDDAKTTFTGLQASGVDAERHSDGFRQLQICLRKSLWELERTMKLIPDDRRETFKAVTDNLSEMQSKLEHLLFPRDSGTPAADKQKH